MILCKTANIAERNAPGGRSLTSVLLGVADSGPGIHPSAQEHVLKAFTTGNAVPREVGRDLGLVVVQSTFLAVSLVCCRARVRARCVSVSRLAPQTTGEVRFAILVASLQRGRTLKLCVSCLWLWGWVWYRAFGLGVAWCVVATFVR